MQSLRQKIRRSFTLIELVVVLVIIATLAGLILPTLSQLGRSTDMAATASSQRELANNLQLFFTLQKRFPQGMDSLLVDNGGADPTAVYTATQADGATVPTGESDQALGLPVSGAGGANPNSDLTLGTLTSGQRRSFTRCGFDFVYDHVYSEVNSNNSATQQRALPSSGTMVAAVVNPTSVLAQRLLPNENGAGTPEPNTQIVAVGIGPRNSAIGKTVNNAPTYPGADGRYYGRFIAYFKVYETGERATLINVSDAYGRTPDYSTGQFNESLPNGSRQG